MRKKSSMSDLGSAVASALDKLGLGGKMREAMVLVKWPEIVGDRIAKVTTAIRVIDGTLFIACKSSVWANELSLHKEHIRTSINKCIGSRIIKEIRFSTRGFAKKAGEDDFKASDTSVDEIDLTPEKEQVAKSVASSASSDKLAEVIRKAVITSLKREKAISDQQDNPEDTNT